MNLRDVIGMRLPGSPGIKDGLGWSPGAMLGTLPPCAAPRESEERVVRAAAGVATRKVRCERDSGSTWAWREVGFAAVDAAYLTSAEADALFLTPAEGNAAYQPLDADLTTIAANITAAGHAILDDANAAAQRVTLGVTEPGTVLISSNTFSAVSAMTADGVFTTAYTNYVLVYELTSLSTAAAHLYLRLRASGVTSSLTYYSMNNYALATGTVGAIAAQNVAQWMVWNGAGTGEDISGRADLVRPQQARKTGLLLQVSGHRAGVDQIAYSGGGFHNTASAYDGFTLLTSAGTMTGAWWLYGRKI